jgi:hypothetical protein
VKKRYSYWIVAENARGQDVVCTANTLKDARSELKAAIRDSEEEGGSYYGLEIFRVESVS